MYINITLSPRTLRATRLLTLTLTHTPIHTRIRIHLADLMHLDPNHSLLPTREIETIPTRPLDQLR